MILDPILQVECDRCRWLAEYGLTPLAGSGWDARDIVSQLRRDHWYVENMSGETICPDCVGEPR